MEENKSDNSKEIGLSKGQEVDGIEGSEEIQKTQARRNTPEPEQHLQVTEKFVAILPQGQIELSSSAIRLDGLMSLGMGFLKWHRRNFNHQRRSYVG